MNFGDLAEIAVSFQPLERSIDSEWVFGQVDIIVANKIILSSSSDISLNVVLNYLRKNAISPMRLENSCSVSSLYLLGCLFSGYLWEGYIPDVSHVTAKNANSDINEFADQYVNLLSLIPKALGQTVEIQLGIELIDLGWRLFLFRTQNEEILVGSSDLGKNLFAHHLPVGSFNRLRESLPIAL